jgi:hypothetical protein
MLSDFGFVLDFCVLDFICVLVIHVLVFIQMLVFICFLRFFKLHVDFVLTVCQLILDCFVQLRYKTGVICFPNEVAARVITEDDVKVLWTKFSNRISSNIFIFDFSVKELKFNIQVEAKCILNSFHSHWTQRNLVSNSIHVFLV